MAPISSSASLQLRPSLPRLCKIQNYSSNRKRKQISDLPDEMLLKIFAHLGQEDLYCNVRLVCKRFLAIASDNTLWKCIQVLPYTPKKRIAQWLRTFGRHVRHLCTNDRSDGNLFFEQVSKYCKNMESITAVNIRGSRRSPLVHAKPLCAMAKRCKRLKKVNLSQCRFASCSFFKLLCQSNNEPVMKSFEYIGPMSAKQLRALCDNELTSNGEEEKVAETAPRWESARFVLTNVVQVFVALVDDES